MSKKQAPSGKLRTRDRTNTLLFVALAAVLGIAAYATLSGPPGSRPVASEGPAAARIPSSLEIAALTLADPRIGEVAGEFHCPCGGCGVMELRECECDMARGALEAKGKIAELLRQGVAPEDVAERIAAAYGARKAPQPAPPGPQAHVESSKGAR